MQVHNDAGMSTPGTPYRFSERQLAWGIVILGTTAFIVFVAILSALYAFENRRIRDAVIDTELPQYARQITVYFDRVFEPTRKGLMIIAGLDVWEDTLARAVDDFAAMRDLTDRWAEILRLPDVTVVDLRRDIIYPFWATEPVFLSPQLERDEWYFSTWKQPDPPEQKITFYYDQEIGGHAFYYDQLIRDDAGNPLGLIGGLHPVESAIEHVQAVLGPGDYIYLVSDNDRSILQISSDGFQYLTEVFGTEGRIPQAARDDDSARSKTAAIDDDSIQRTIALPIDGMTALIVTSVGERLRPVRRALTLQFFVILFAFVVLIGGYLLIVRTYSRRTANQLETIQRQRDAIEDLLSIMTHNLGNDLHSLRQQLAPPGRIPDRRRLPSGQSVEVTIADMEQAIQNTVYSTRLADKTVRLRRDPVNPRDLLNRLEAMFRPVADAKEQRLEIVPGTDAVIHTDEDILFHILLNLLTNAGKYADPGTRVLLGVTGSDRECIFVVADQGPGFRTDDLDRLFARHGRLSARPTMGERSTGLGLYVSRHLADMCGADLRLRDGVPGAVAYDPHRDAYSGAVWEVAVPRRSHV